MSFGCDDFDFLSGVHLTFYVAAKWLEMRCTRAADSHREAVKTADQLKSLLSG